MPQTQVPTSALTQRPVAGEARTSSRAARVVVTHLLAREPGTDDYELARTLLAETFPSGHTASALLYAYRERDLDLSVETVSATTGTTTRLVMMTGFTAPELAGNR